MVEPEEVELRFVFDDFFEDGVLVGSGDDAFRFLGDCVVGRLSE
jgi:hypothetical protein